MDSRSLTQTLSCCYLHKVWSVVVCLLWNVESTLELDCDEASTPLGLNGPYFELIYYDDRVYECWIDFRLIIVHKGVLVILQGCTKG